jgi:hypothetical protein
VKTSTSTAAGTYTLTIRGTSSSRVTRTAKVAGADGVSVVAGSNAVAVFDTRAMPEAVKRRFANGHRFSCFRSLTMFGHTGLDDENWMSLPFGSTEAFGFNNAAHPFDGCGIQGGFQQASPVGAAESDVDPRPE